MTLSGILAEAKRNIRIQLRPRRMVAVAAICMAVSFSLIASNLHSQFPGFANAARQILRITFVLQILALLMGGSIYCLQSVYREKDLNTFDYQRITRLTPVELALGKLFGAPAVAYFVVLCFMPVTLGAAFTAGIPLSTLITAYLMLFVGAMAYQLVAILLSLVLPKDTFVGAIMLFLLLLGFTSSDFGGNGVSTFVIHALSPSFAYSLLFATNSFPNSDLGPLKDLFFGVPISHVVVLPVIDATLAAWCLLAIGRNLKRDPSFYELYRPSQALALALYLNVLLLGFFRWDGITYSYMAGSGRVVTHSTVSGIQAEGILLGFSLWIFGLLGLSLLRNRERSRRCVHALTRSAVGWWNAIWPAQYVFAGATITGLGVVAMIQSKIAPQMDWTPAMGIFEAIFIAAWISRDMLYLQWMSLRSTRKPLTSAALYLTVFYVCAGIMISTFGLFGIDSRRPYSAALVPITVLSLNTNSWLSYQSQWIGALLLLTIEIAGLCWLQMRKLREFMPATRLAAQSD